MDEAQWLLSDDPQAMLRLYTSDEMPWPAGQPAPRLSDRKLRLFACAVARSRGHDPESVSAVEGCVEARQPNHNFSDAYAVDRGEFWRRCRSIDAARGAAHAYCGATTAALLRDVIGNPWRPVVLPVLHRQGCDADPDSPERAYSSCSCTCPWLTPDVLALAAAAYQERPGRVCERCDGRKRFWVNAGPYESGWEKCEDCGGTGRISDGTLDPVTLGVLADALQDAGCEDGTILNHLRGKCPACTDKTGFQWGKVADCRTCNGSGESSAPHIRGCWAIDLLLGKS